MAHKMVELLSRLYRQDQAGIEYAFERFRSHAANDATAWYLTELAVSRVKGSGKTLAEIVDFSLKNELGERGPDQVM